ncbi:hypothetical protein ROZALSC1DRAFT_24223 [Rozella allomycis CSF55]|uniref:Uncharacterized protein n=1 Tax=Rozella allomycis (strain CSF55) TaxID=988480 RepID=A0A4V1IZA9_ROZAC|nr:hypothetical protein ROZALSC1DRAFT_24223 [Rozella allomycis CSF55]
MKLVQKGILSPGHSNNLWKLYKVHSKNTLYNVVYNTSLFHFSAPKYAVYSVIDFAHSSVFCEEYERKFLIFEDPQSELGEPQMKKIQTSLRTSNVDFSSITIRSVLRSSQQPLYLEATGTRIQSTQNASMVLRRELELAFPGNL